MTDETKREEQRKALADIAAMRPPHPTDDMNLNEREAYYEQRRQERWAEAHEIEARVPGLWWGDETPGSRPPYGNGTPWQGEGWLGSEPFYARFRYNRAAITIFNRPYNAFEHGITMPRPKELRAAVIDDFYTDERAAGGYAGTLNGIDEITEFFERLIPELKPVSAENPSHYMQMRKAVEEMMAAHRATE